MIFNAIQLMTREIIGYAARERNFHRQIDDSFGPVGNMKTACARIRKSFK